MKTPTGTGITQRQAFDALLLLGGMWGAWRIYKWVKSATGGDNEPSGYRPGTPSLDRNKLREIADRIYAAAWEGGIFYEDEEDMNAALLEVGNDADVYLLIEIYGVRGPGIGYAALNLIQTFHATHNDAELAAVNAALAAKGITAQL